MGKSLSDAEIAGYHRDGFLCPIDVFSPEEARGFRDRLEGFEERDGRQFGKGHNFKPHLLFPWVDALVRHPAVLDPVEDIIGPDIGSSTSRSGRNRPATPGLCQLAPGARPISAWNRRCTSPPGWR